MCLDSLVVTVDDDDARGDLARLRVPLAATVAHCETVCLRLRALHGTGDLDDYLDFHFQQEKRRNHDSRNQQSQELAA